MSGLKKLSRRTIIATVFVAASLISLAFIMSATWNYGNYYWAAQSSIVATLNSVHLKANSGTGDITVETSVSVTNPTAYSGLKVFAFEVTIYFLNSSHASLFRDEQLLGNINPSKPLGPMSTVTSIVPIPLSTSQSGSFRMFNQTNQGRVSANVFYQVIVDSFLNSVTGRLQRVDSTEIPIS